MGLKNFKDYVAEAKSGLETESEDLLKKMREKLNNLRNKVGKENNDEEKGLIKLKNYQVNNQKSSFSIDIDDTYGLTIKKVDGKIVFDAKHEGFVNEEYFELDDNEIIDNGNIDMINRYLKAQDKALITDSEDIKKLNVLFEKLK